MEHLKLLREIVSLYEFEKYDYNHESSKLNLYFNRYVPDSVKIEFSSLILEYLNFVDSHIEYLCPEEDVFVDFWEHLEPEDSFEQQSDALDDENNDIHGENCILDDESCTFEEKRDCEEEQTSFGHDQSSITNKQASFEGETYSFEEKESLSNKPKLSPEEEFLKLREEEYRRNLQAKAQNGSSNAGTNGEQNGNKLKNYDFRNKAPIKTKTAIEGVLYRGEITASPTPIKDFYEVGSDVCFEGTVINIENKTLSTGKVLYSFLIYDQSSTAKAKVFLNDRELELFQQIKAGGYYKISGKYTYDNFEKVNIVILNAMNVAKPPVEPVDTAEKKRVELHVHSNFSTLNSLMSVKNIAKKLKSWGHQAFAIADDHVVQAYPDAMDVAGEDFKVIFGMEAIVYDSSRFVINKDIAYSLDDEFVVFDIETTGLSPLSCGITEIACVKIKNKKIVEHFSTFVNPQMPIPEKITQLTGITNEMVKDAPLVEEMLKQFYEFVGNAVLVAHNSYFDTSFIDYYSKKCGFDYKCIHIDNLQISRLLLTELKKHKLDVVARHLNVKLDSHHRAIDDTIATAEIFENFLKKLAALGLNTVAEVEEYAKKTKLKNHYNRNNILILVHEQAGMSNLYKIVSESHTKYFNKVPMIPRSSLEQYAEGLWVGTCGDEGELINAIFSGKSQEELLEITNYYDFHEILPRDYYDISRQAVILSKQDVVDANQKIYELCKKTGKTCIASAAPRYFKKSDREFFDILLYSNNRKRNAYYHFLNTDEMLKEFEYLGKEAAYEVVVENTNAIADKIFQLYPIPKKKFPPHIEGSEENLRNMCYAKARSIYGEQLPEIVESRLERELNSIISNGYSVLYVIAQKIVNNSVENGFLVGSRGSVGSSFAATMAGITEVNPLVPHYHCLNCKYSEFITDNSVASGFDLPPKDCPNCKIPMKKDGQNIPFETFLGFKGDKEPDIDLNFASIYQEKAHDYTRELFGSDHVFKAGTIGTIAEKTAFGYVKKYYEEVVLANDDMMSSSGMDAALLQNRFHFERLAREIVGVKRTTGQHPGGLIVIPNDNDVHDFCPIQYPANDEDKNVFTTHFDYNALHETILKLDLLGHEVPTQLKYLKDMTQFEPMDIPLDDPATLSIFNNADALNIIDPSYDKSSGSLAIPEFGTKFTMGMLKDIKPTKFSELVDIAGLAHGTDVWLNNAQDLVVNKGIPFSDIIATRDEIMIYLISMGLDPSLSFKIMEMVRKGKGLTPEFEEQMIANNVPDWYIESCKKIKYMFPKAHAAAYVMMSIRIAYYKVYFPHAFYCATFNSKIEDFDAQIISQGKEAIVAKIEELKSRKITKKEEDTLGVLEIALEMYARGLICEKVDLEKSLDNRFIPTDKGILPPLGALSGIGENNAYTIVKAREEAPFVSIQDLKSRGGANRTAIDALKIHGCLKGLPENNQFSLEMFL